MSPGTYNVPIKAIVPFTVVCLVTWPLSGSEAGVDLGCLPFTKTFRKFQLESKWYTTFRVGPVEKFREQRNV